MAQAFDVFFKSNKLLDIVILARGRREYRIVDYDAMDHGVGVGGEDGLFEFFFIDDL